jgi:phosphoglycolate phosphatase-like HAD superfamily hydrolase
MKLIFDFDHTLFDMSAMHEDIVKELEKQGVPRDKYFEQYLGVTRWKMFSVPSMAQRLLQVHRIDPKIVENIYHDTADQAELYVYDDVPATCQDLRDRGHSLYLLSWGDENWQNRKIDKSGLKPHFVETFTVPQVKADYLGGWCDDKCNVVLIDDKPAELKAIQQQYPEFHLIRVRRANGKSSDQETPTGVFEAKTMADVARCVGDLAEQHRG